MLGSCPPEKKKRMERNKRTNAQRDPEKRNRHFSFTVEVKREDESRLESLHSRLNDAKSLLGIDRTTTSTQNADLLEVLLSTFETMRPSSVKARSTSVASTITRPIPSAPNQQPKDSMQAPEPRRPQKRQIYVDAKADDTSFICTGESLKSLVKYFSGNPQCKFCGGNYKWSAMKFSHQSHVCRLEIPCICSDSVVWLSSGFLGHPAKYSANVR